MRLIKLFLFILPSVLIPSVFANGVSKSTVLVCYGRLDPDDIKGYGTVILESEHYNSTEIKQIKSQNDKVLAYISLGEVNKNARHYNVLKDGTLGKNKIWDSYYLNLKSANTRKVLLDIIADILKNGYDGLFLDNIDNFTVHGPQPEQQTDLVSLLASIDVAFPNSTFIQNAGLDLLPETAGFVDGVVLESVATNYTFADKNYKLREVGDYQNYVRRLNDIKSKYSLPVILIEYANSGELRNAVESRLKPLGIEYFIGNINLQTIPQFQN